MEEQISTGAPSQAGVPGSSIPPTQVMAQPSVPPAFTDVEAMKQRARELAIAQYMAQQKPQESAPVPEFSPQVPTQIVYVKRNLTVAELILFFVLSVGIWTGVQFTWNFAVNSLPKIEVNIRK